jgi:hypothetical protein
MKTAVVFLDVENQIINVVLGKLLKQVKVSDVGVDHNVDFFNTLFSEHKVVLVDQASVVTKDEFFSSIGGQSETERMMATSEDDVEAPIIESRAAVKTLPKSAVVQTPRPQATVASNYSEGIWLRSNAKAIIIIDDIYNPEQAGLARLGGERMSVSLHPDRALDISALDKEQVKKSRILRKLLSNGTLSECTSREAQAIEDKYWAKENQKRKLEDKDLDKMLIPDGVSAEDYASGVRTDDEITTVNIDAREDVEPETDYDDLLKTMRKNREEPAEVETKMTLAQQLAMAEEAETAPRRQLVRERAPVDPTQTAKGLRSRHR